MDEPDRGSLWAPPRRCRLLGRRSLLRFRLLFGWYFGTTLSNWWAGREPVSGYNGTSCSVRPRFFLAAWLLTGSVCSYSARSLTQYRRIRSFWGANATQSASFRAFIGVGVPKAILDSCRAVTINFLQILRWFIPHVNDLHIRHPIKRRKPQELLLFGPREQKVLAFLGLQSEREFPIAGHIVFSTFAMLLYRLNVQKLAKWHFCRFLGHLLVLNHEHAALFC